MTKLESLYSTVYDGGVDVVDYHISDTKKAVCIYSMPTPTIVLDVDAIKTSAEETTLLAEGYEHFEVGALYFVETAYNTPLARSNRIAAEGRAERHAIRRLVPWAKLSESLPKCVYAEGLDVFELAEEFEVTPEFIKSALRYYVDVGKRW
jgi:hypothetical protein